MSLWKETFGDSSEYISLVFDTYFSPDKIAFHEEGGEIKAALLTLPYSFESSAKTELKGLYLCGLATRKDARHRGLMSGLLEETNQRAKEAGFDFTFLIPSEEGIRRYYRDRGYHDAFYKKKEYYVKGHKFGNAEGFTILKYEGKNEETVLKFLLGTGNLPYKGKNSFLLQHTQEDWETVLKEALISGDTVYLAYKDDTIKSIGFCKIKHQSIDIKKLIAIDKQSEEALLNGISKENPDCNIILTRDLESLIEQEDSNQLWSPFYAQNNSKNAEYEDIAVIEEPYNETMNSFSFGMINIFNLEGLLRKTGYDNLKSLDAYSEEEIKKLVLRKPVGRKADALEQILNLPEINFSMSLMLE